MRYAVKRAVKFFFFCNCLLVFFVQKQKTFVQIFKKRREKFDEIC